MTTFAIKILAVVTMIIDHIGYFFVPDLLVLRLIGRMSFPLFAWMIANGAIYSKNIDKYLQRLFIFGIASQLPFYYAHMQQGNIDIPLNVIFTLFLGLLFIKVYKTKGIKFLALIVLSSIFILRYISIEYGLTGALSVLMFYIFYNQFWLNLIAQIVLFFANYLESYDVAHALLLMTFSMTAFAPIYLYNKKRGPSAKYLFYIVYPLQYLFFYILLNI